jgi:hypothetical protein
MENSCWKNLEGKTTGEKYRQKNTIVKIVSENLVKKVLLEKSLSVALKRKQRA